MDDWASLTSSGGLTSILLSVLVVSLFVNLFFVNSKLLNKIKKRSDEKKLPGEIQKYLNTQAYKTANSHKFHYIPKLYDAVIKFRSAYLRIESKSIDRDIDSQEYWNLVNSKLNSLLKVASSYVGNRPMINIRKKIELIKSLVAKSKSIKEKKHILECLNNFYKACDQNSNENKMEEYDKKLNKIILRFTDKYYVKLDGLITANDKYVGSGKSAATRLGESAKEMDAKIDKISGNSKPVIASIEKCKKNNAAILNSVDSVKGSLYELEQKVNQVQGAEDGGKSAQNGSGELADLSEMIQEENEKEISRLKGVIKNQKSTIGELEEQLDSMLEDLKSQDEPAEGERESGLSETEKKRNIAIIESLKNNLRDAEYCIRVLEEEVENIKSKSDIIEKEANASEESSSVSIGQEDLDSLEATIDGLRTEIEDKSKENVLLKKFSEFSESLFQGDTVEDLALLLYETLGEANVDVVLKVYTPARNFEVCGSGKIPPRMSTLIDNLQLNENSLNGGVLFFKYKNFGGAIHAKNGEKLSKLDVSHILKVANLTDKTINLANIIRLSKGRSQKLDECENNVKKTFSELDKSFEKISSSAVSAIEDAFKQMRDLGRSSGMGASQIASISRLESSVVDEINSERVTRLKAKKSFLKMLGDLESIRY